MRHVFIVLVWYDVALTFATEVQRIWRRRFSGATIIYLIIRYTMLLQSTLYVVTVVLYHSSDKVSALKIFPPDAHAWFDSDLKRPAMRVHG